MKSPKKIKHIFLDWSGTLFDDFSQSYISTKYVIEKISDYKLSKQEYRSEFELPAENFYKKYNPHISFSEVDQLYFDHFKRRSKRAKLYSQVLDFLKLAKKKKINLYIFSTVKKDLLEELLEKFKIDSSFKKVFGGIIDKEKELVRIINQLKIDKSQTIFIGDLDHDIKSAQKAKIYSGAMTHGYYSLDRLVKSSPDFIFPDFSSLIRFINSFEITGLGKKSSGKVLATVGALIFNQGKIFLIQTHKWGYTFGIPGGKVEFKEPMVQAVKREILEETGLKIKNIRYAMIQDSICSKEFYKKNQHFILVNYYANSNSRKFVLNEEAESGIWVEPQDALRLNLNEPTRKLIEEYLSQS